MESGKIDSTTCHEWEIYQREKQKTEYASKLSNIYNLDSPVAIVFVWFIVYDVRFVSVFESSQNERRKEEKK
jgi:hypothetical protein